MLPSPPIEVAGFAPAAALRNGAPPVGPSVGTAAGPVKGHSPAGSGSVQPGEVPHSFVPRRMERVQSSSGRLRAGHTPSQSRNQHSEVRTVGEYALHHLFTAFIALADQKINLCVNGNRGFEMRTEAVCGRGVDPALDQLISALGHIARQKPKPLIDTLMLWRKEKSNLANAARDRLFNTRANVSTASLQGGIAQTESTLTLQQHFIQADRRSTLSIYLLCRVLEEIFEQSSLANITPELTEKLEDIIYKQLIQLDPEQLEESAFRQSNWIVYGQLLGAMCEVDFQGVSHRYLTDLQRMQLHVPRKESEGRAVLLIQSMRWLRLKYQPEPVWERTCEFLLSLGLLATTASGQHVKHAFNSLFETLLLPIAAGASSELSTTKWAAVVDTLKPRLVNMLAKPKHWSSVFPTLVILLCVSPMDVFASSWLSLVAPIQQRLKERVTRAQALTGICRLLWTYLYRGSDHNAAIIKNVTDIIKLVFIPGKKSFISADPDVAEPLIQLIRIIGFKCRDLCFRTIIFPLMNAEQFSSGKEIKIAEIEPEKIVIGIRSFLVIMSDLERGEHPPFPVNFDSHTAPEPFRFPTQPLSPKSSGEQKPNKTTLKGEDRLSQPVAVTGFDEVTSEAFAKFCKILGEITLFCDNTFGGQATLDEKFSSPVPKTPMAEAFSFARKDENLLIDIRQGFYDLLHVAVQALPRCLPRSSSTVINKALVNLLCTGTAHVKSNIAASSVQSLKSIARQNHAQQVTIGFSRFIFNFDNRYSTMSDGGLLGPDHIESTLQLYVELLEIWIEEITRQKRSNPSSPENVNGIRAAKLDFSTLWAHVDEIESHGLFFLCSPSSRVRSFAIKVLSLIVDFDTALGKTSTRIIRILESSPQSIINVDDEKLSVVEKTRLQKAVAKPGEPSPMLELCSSDAQLDVALWLKIFPSAIARSYEQCPQACALTREIVCARLVHMQKPITSYAEGSRIPGTSQDLMASPRSAGSGVPSTSLEKVVEQWGIYLVFACTTMTNPGAQAPSTPSLTHNRKGSKPAQAAARIQSAGELFARIIPFLACANRNIREAVVNGLGCINKNIYRTLLDALQPAISSCDEESTARQQPQRGVPTVKWPRRTLHLRTEIAHVCKLTSHFLQSPDIYEDEWILANLVNYTQELRLFLLDEEVQMEWDFQRLRTHYCGLMEELYRGIKKTKEPFRWISFQSRKAAFVIMEDWCGHSPDHSRIRLREENLRRSMLASGSLQDMTNNSGAVVSSAMEFEKRDLRTAALSAMAMLCAGPVSIEPEGRSQPHLSFDIRRMLEWIDSIFNDESDRIQGIGRRALKSLIISNKDHPYFLGRTLEMCFLAKTPKALGSYVEVATQVLTETEDFAPHMWKVIGACTFALGNESKTIRMKSARLLRTLEERQYKASFEERQYKSSKLQELEISVSDKTIAVYKRAQFEMSQRVAQQHPDMAFHVFSEFAKFFKDLSRDGQRSMVAAMLPWCQVIDLQLDPNGGPDTLSYSVLVNLFELTFKFGNILHNEIQALWQALAASSFPQNAQVILDFIIQLCLERREQSFVDFARQIVVHLAATNPGKQVIEFLLLQITPKSMIPDKDRRQSYIPPPETHTLPYVADLNKISSDGPTARGQQGLSLGQLSLMLLVDLLVAPVDLPAQYLPMLIHVCLILWDHYIPRVRDQAQEMLVHLMHELVISKSQESSVSKASIEDLIELIRHHDKKATWGYDDMSGNEADGDNRRVPSTMIFVSSEVVRIFASAYPNIKEDLGKTALKWASNCHVVHLACRSFQLFRCIMSSLEQNMLGDILGRLSNTISDEGADIQKFSMECLRTLRAIVDAFPPENLVQYPQLFWTTYACLSTVHENEFMESLAMLEQIMDKIDLSDPPTVQALIESKAPNWEGSADGLLSLVYKGVRSSVSVDASIKAIERLVSQTPGELIGDSSGLLFAILANLPRYMHSIETGDMKPEIVASATTLASLAESRGYLDLSDVLRGFLSGMYRSEQDFFTQMFTALKAYYFPDLEFQTLVFIMGLLTNKLPWFKIKVMQILCMMIPQIDMRKTEIASKGADLITPLLRLLQTEYCPQALAVLDNVMTMNATAMDSKHLRMSMIGAHSSRAIKKEYEKTASLYGIPEDSGWSIPIPAYHSGLTRSNVHAVFYTCASADIPVPSQDSPAEIQMVGEEFDGSFPDYRTTTMTSDDARTDVPAEDLLNNLESLDDFFDDEPMDSPPTMPSHSGIVGRHNNNSSTDVREQLYEQQTMNLLSRSLKRNTSISSFHGMSQDYRISPSREGAAMTPTAFIQEEGENTSPNGTLIGSTPNLSTVSLSSISSQTSTIRGGTLSRSATSPPAGPFYSQSSAPGMGNEVTILDDAPFFSDEEMLPTPRLSHENNSPGFSMITSPSQSFPMMKQPSANNFINGNIGGLNDFYAHRPPFAPPFAPPLHSQQPTHAQLTMHQREQQRIGTVRSGFRSGFRRLTGSSMDAKARDLVRRELLQKSPQVPPVPSMYLQNNNTAPNVAMGYPNTSPKTGE
jgi:Cell morphogenesis N-terminal/Cell morphogenesis C-terminal/Cell morphogenesis central region